MITIGVDLDKPLGPVRRNIVSFLINWFGRCQLFCLSVEMKLKVLKPEDVDYKYYLGPSYQKAPKGKVSTIVCNHCSPTDCQLVTAALDGHLSFVAGTHTLAVPGLCRVVKACGCITMPMGGSERDKEVTRRSIEERQKAIENGSAYLPFVIFPEGTLSNNTCLLPFRNGAFKSLKAVTPVTIKYRWTWF